MENNKNAHNQNAMKPRKRIDPIMTLEYHSIYQSGTDVVAVIGACITAILVAISIIALIYLLLTTPIEELNLFCVLHKLFSSIISSVLKLIRLICVMYSGQ